MTVEQLDELAERVKAYFLTQIMELSNSEVEHVCERLRDYFEESVERVRSARD